MLQCLENGELLFSLSKCYFKMLSAVCRARTWVDLFLHFGTRESASDLQIAFIMRHIIHWWIMCGLPSRYTAFKIAHLSCKPHPQREAGPSGLSKSRRFCICFPWYLRSLFLPYGSDCVDGLWIWNTRTQSQFMEKTWDGERIFKSLLRK